MIVVDASVLANAFTDTGSVGRRGREELRRDRHWIAPEHVLVETLFAIRGRLLGKKITPSQAAEALDGLTESAIELVSTRPLLRRIWELRPNLTTYDAAYVAVAEAHSCTLLTADARLARASAGCRCEIRLGLPEERSGRP